jgi:hypothetical protein
MAVTAEKEIHTYIDDLCNREYYGEVTLYFQKGEIGNVRETARLGKSDIITRYNEAVPDRKRVLTVRIPRKRA